MLFFEREQGGERSIAVQLQGLINIPVPDFDEFLLLIDAAGVEVVSVLEGSRKKPHPANFLGSGKLEELQALVEENDVDVVLFNNTLSPGQERNLEAVLKCRVVDRTGVILDIFAQRARTHEGKLQVELAQLTHLSTRLVRGWTHLERQKGGIGLRGPGETQLESDRRMLRDRIKALKSRLDKVRSQRDQNRQPRLKQEIPSVSLVGYTNAGKSSLFNHLTDSEVMAKDMLFATLDPTYRHWSIPELGPLVLVDTVGFVRYLPHKLVEAFGATLEESVHADLLLHLVDASHVDSVQMIDAVEDVLEEIGASEIPCLQVHNKIDLLGIEPRIDRNDVGEPVRVWLSAQTGAGFDLLKQAIVEILGTTQVKGVLSLGPNQGALRSQLYEVDAVVDETIDKKGGYQLQLVLPEARLLSLLAQYKVNESDHWKAAKKNKN